MVFGNVGVSDWHERAARGPAPVDRRRPRAGTRRSRATTSPTARWRAATSTAPSARSPRPCHRRARWRRTTASRSASSLHALGHPAAAPVAPRRRSPTPSRRRLAHQRRRPESVPARHDRRDRGAGAARARPSRRGERSGQRAVERLGERVPQARSIILGTRRRRAARGRPDRGGLRRAHPQRRDRAGRLPGALGAAARARARHAGDPRRAHRVRRARRQEPRARRSCRSWPRRAARSSAARRSSRHCRSSSASRPTATGSPACTTGATWRASSAATPPPRAGPFSLAVLDLDHFKVVNDRFGHPAGDEVLMRVAALLLGDMRGQDVVVRTGGEEFVLLMPPDRRQRRAHRVRAPARGDPRRAAGTASRPG